MKCVACHKDILEGDIFVSIGIDIHRLIYSKLRNGEDFLAPYGPIHSKAVFPLCESCAPKDLMSLSPKDVATVLGHIQQS